MFRVDLFRRTVYRSNSVPLIQFYGLRAVRKWKVGERKPKDWTEIEGQPRLHTVDFDPKDLVIHEVKKGKKK